MKVIRHRDGTFSLRVDSERLADLVSGMNLAYVHWQKVAQLHELTSDPNAAIDGEIRDDYKDLMDELANIAEGVR